MKTTVLIAAITAGLTLVAVDASADGRGGPREKPEFATLDADGNSAISLEELQNAGAARFAEMDTDGNGALSVEELAAARAAEMADRAAKMIARMDENGDGELQADEMKPRGRGDYAARMFGHMDADDDGKISQEEYDAAGEGRRGRGKSDGGRG
ncbi:MAG: calcium-binding protein [Yoonia sp.]|nr:calcium-binding protein [Yoonia sp.]MDG1863963.1 calcium-binding protein [Yoonia sp.]